MDVASVLRSVHRDRLSLSVRGRRHPMPLWADWLIWLGVWMRSQAALDGRRVAVVRLPTKRLAAAFVGLGGMLASAGIHDDSLDWDALQMLPLGTKVHWRETRGGKSILYSGFIGETREYAGTPCLAITVHAPKKAVGSTTLLPKPAALSYGVTLGTVTSRVEEKLSTASALMRAVVDGASLSWLRSVGSDGTLLTERSSFINDLEEFSLAAGNVHLSMLDALAVSTNELRYHGKLQVVPARVEAFRDSERGLTILDGAVAVTRLGASCARSVIVLLEHSEYDEEVAHAISPFLGNAVQTGIHAPIEGIPPVPEGIEPFMIALSTAADTGGRIDHK
jgi:hypothetical protein